MCNLKEREFILQKFYNTPLKDSVKENIFNIIEHSPLIKTSIEKANVLDYILELVLLELSVYQGVLQGYFVEHNEYASKILKGNLVNLSISTKSKILNYKVEDALNALLMKNLIFFLTLHLRF